MSIKQILFIVLSFITSTTFCLEEYCLMKRQENKKTIYTLFASRLDRPYCFELPDYNGNYSYKNIITLQNNDCIEVIEYEDTENQNLQAKKKEYITTYKKTYSTLDSFLQKTLNSLLQSRISEIEKKNSIIIPIIKETKKIPLHRPKKIPERASEKTTKRTSPHALSPLNELKQKRLSISPNTKILTKEMNSLETIDPEAIKEEEKKVDKIDAEKLKEYLKTVIYTILWRQYITQNS